MNVRAGDLRPEGLEVDQELHPGRLTDEAGLEIGVARARLRARVRPEERGLRCAGQLAADIEVPCSRCLERYPVSIEREFDLEYRAAATPEAPEGEVQLPRGDLDLAWLDEKGSLDVEAMAVEQPWLRLVSGTQHCS